MEHNHHPGEKNSHSMHDQHQHEMQTPAVTAAHAAHDHAKNPPHGHMEHDHHAMMISDFKKRFYVVLGLTLPILLLSPMIQHWLNLHIAFTGSVYILFALSSVVFAYG